MATRLGGSQRQKKDLKILENIYQKRINHKSKKQNFLFITNHFIDKIFEERFEESIEFGVGDYWVKKVSLFFKKPFLFEKVKL